VTGQPIHPDGKTRIVESLTSADGTRTVERHIGYWWDNDTNAKRNRDFYVVDPGEPGEYVAWIKGQDPKPESTGPRFSEIAINWLRDKVGVTVPTLGTVKHIGELLTDNAAQTGTADVLVDDGSNLVWTQVYLWLDAGEVKWEEIPTAV
jgi:hypothetical protein